MSDDLFIDDNEDEFTPEVTTPEGSTVLDTLVGDGKKFKDVEALAKAKLEADQYIAFMKTKMREVQTDLSTRLSLEQFAEQLRAPRAPEPDDVDPPAPTPPAKELDPEKLAEMIEATLSKKEQQKAVNANRELVVTTLEDKYGINAKKVLSNKARELGMSLADLQSVADRSPKAFFALVGVEGDSPSAPPVVPTSTVNTTGQQPGTVRGHSWYEAKKKSDPKWYNSPEASVQQFKDMKALGLDKYYAS